MKFDLNIPGLNRLTRKQRKLAAWSAGLLLFYTVFGFFILPPVIRSVAVKKLAAQLNRDVAIEKVKLNPFALSATIRGLLIKDKDGQPFVSWDEVYVNFQLASFFGKPWVFKEVSTSRPFLRVQMNKDYTLNFSDLIDQFSTNAPATAPAKPLALSIDRLHITGATAALTDLTPRTPFRRVLGPLDVTLMNFRTDPDNRNPYSFSGTTDAGEKFSWSGYFYLDPLRSRGQVSLENLALNKYAPLYQDLVRFQIRDGVVDLSSSYELELSSSNRVAIATNATFRLHSFKLAEAGSDANLAELAEFAVTNASLDVNARRAEVGSISSTAGKLLVRREKDQAVNLVELSKPAEAATNAPGGILLLLRSVTNAVTLLLNSTNTWTATVQNLDFHDCELELEDLANSRPARLNLSHIDLAAKNISNLPGRNLSASLSLRWNTNGTVKTDVEAAFLPPTADIRLALDQLDLRSLDPYLEPVLNLFILGSKLSLDGQLHLRTTNAELPVVTFEGNARLDDFATVDGVLGEDLLKWRSVRWTGIDANLNPPAIGIQEISVDDAYARVVIETNRAINLLAALRMDQAAPATPAAAKRNPPNPPPAGPETGRSTTAAALPKVTIGRIVITNAQLEFTDRSLMPNVNLTVQQGSGTLSGLSSDELQHAQVDLHAKVDNVGPVEITGTINPFTEHQTNELNITVRDVDLTPTSPYSGKFAGYRITKGKLDLSLVYRLRGRALQAENLITLHQFTFGQKVESPDATHLPVRLAVAILKDRNGEIKLDVPIEGSLDDPQFKLHKVIVRAIGNILAKIVTSPFAALSSIFGGKGEEIRFQNFAPGTPELLAGEKEKLDALAKGLYERPGLQVEIEGSIDPQADRDGLQRASLEKRLRMAKWLSLRKSARDATSPAQLPIAPEERVDLIQQLYNEAVSKGEITAGSLDASVPGAHAEGGSGSFKGRTDEETRGAANLMQSETAVEIPSAAGNRPNPAAGPGGVELALVKSLPVTAADFEALASDRAKAVRDYLLQSGKVEPDRLFLAEKQPGGVKAEGARVYLQLH